MFRARSTEVRSTVSKEDPDQDFLTAVYLADRQQSATTVSTISNVAVALIAYLGATAVFIASDDRSLPGGLLLVLPLPALGLLFFHLMLFTIMAGRTYSILIVERELIARTVLAEKAALLGQSGEERLTNLHAQPRLLWPVGSLGYAIDLGLIVSYTAFCVALAVDDHGWTMAAKVAAIVYSLIGLCASIALLYLARELKRSAILLKPNPTAGSGGVGVA